MEKLKKIFIVRHARLDGGTKEKGKCFENIGFWQASTVIDTAIAICCLINDKEEKVITIRDIPYTSEEEIHKMNADIKHFVKHQSLDRLQVCDDTKIVSAPDIAAKETAMFLATALTQQDFEIATWSNNAEEAYEKILQNKCSNLIIVAHDPFTFIRKFISLFVKKLGYPLPYEALPKIDNGEALCVVLTNTRPKIFRIKSAK